MPTDDLLAANLDDVVDAIKRLSTTSETTVRTLSHVGVTAEETGVTVQQLKMFFPDWTQLLEDVRDRLQALDTILQRIERIESAIVR